MKRKILLVVAMVIALASLLAISAFADSVHANVDKSQTVTLSDGTVLNLFDGEGNALIWYIDESAESGYSSIRADANTEGGPFVQYTCSWTGSTHGKTAYQVGTVAITDAKGNAFNNKQIVVFNIMDDDVLTTGGSSSKTPVNCFSGVFSGCSNLQYAYLRLDTVNLFDSAFQNCSSLKYVNLEDITTLLGIEGANAFNGCPVLFENEVLDLSGTSVVQIGVNSNSKGGTFNGVPFKKVILPEGLEVIGHYAFQSCAKLEEINLPSTLTTIGGDTTFKGATALTTVTGFENASVKQIPANMFYGCSSLTTIGLPSGITTIGGNAFYRCSSLTTIDLPNGLTTIGNGAFYQCTALENITIPSTVTKINGATYNDDGTFEGCTSLKSITIPKALKDIYGNAFTSSGLETVIFEDRLLEDGTYNPLTFHGWAPFESCKSITKVVLPEGLTNLPNGMFNACSSLQSVTFASTITTISGGSHFKSTALSEVIGLENTQITYIADSMFRGCRAWTGDENGAVRLPNTCQYIEIYGLADVQMTTLYLGTSFVGKETGNTQAFAGATNLKYVYAPATTTVLTPGNAPFQCIFLTSSDEDVIATLKTTTGIENVITIAQYKAGEYTSGSKYIVTGYNLCDAFYDGHLEGGEETGKWTGDKFLSNYMITCPCERECGAETIIKDLAPLFTSKGFASSGDAMMQAFAINQALWESEYQALFPELKYGMVAAYNGVNAEIGFDTTSGKIVNANGTGINSKVAIVDMTERGFDVFEIKIAGVGAETYKATSFFFCAYVVLDGQVYYLNNGTTSDAATGVCYNDVADFTSYDYIPVSKEENENV